MNPVSQFQVYITKVLLTLVITLIICNPEIVCFRTESLFSTWMWEASNTSSRGKELWPLMATVEGVGFIQGSGSWYVVHLPWMALHSHTCGGTKWTRGKKQEQWRWEGEVVGVGEELEGREWGGFDQSVLDPCTELLNSKRKERMRKKKKEGRKKKVRKKGRPLYFLPVPRSWPLYFTLFLWT